MNDELSKYINLEHSLGESCGDCRYGYLNSYRGFGTCYKFHSDIPDAHMRICDCIKYYHNGYIFPDAYINIKMGY